MKDKGFLEGIAGKLSILLGGAVAISGMSAAAITTAVPLSQTNAATFPMVKQNVRNLPGKLILKQQRSGYRMIASHGSHSSHASHASHSSHSSRAI